MTAVTRDPRAPHGRPRIAVAPDRATLAAGLCALVLLAGSVAGEVLIPRQRLADTGPRIDLASQVPETIGEWRVLPGVSPLLPDPAVQATLDRTYTQVLSRTYVNRAGEQVMLSIAYGADQASEATAVHRPEFCYRASGFVLGPSHDDRLVIGSTVVPVRRMTAVLGQRVEPITYWVTLDTRATLPGLRRKLDQIAFGLSGRIADGMLVRVSSLKRDESAAWAGQATFLAALHDRLPPAVRSRYFGDGAVGTDR